MGALVGLTLDVSLTVLIDDAAQARRI